MGEPLRSDLGTYLIAPNDCITATRRKNKYELRSPPVHSFCPTRSAGTFVLVHGRVGAQSQRK